jgi:excinuclease ABC subunit A
VERKLAVKAGRIELRQVAVHNLKQLDLDIHHHQLTVICGVSGSGKTSLALDTLYAEGQRRYIESFSTYTRQFLDPLDKPAADRIDGLPPAVAVTRGDPTRSSRVTVGTATEIADYLRLVFGKAGVMHCVGCGQVVSPDSPGSVLRALQGVPNGRRLMLAFPRAVEVGEAPADTLAQLKELGFNRFLPHHPDHHSPLTCDDPQSLAVLEQLWQDPGQRRRGLLVIVDRVVFGETSESRWLDSLETCFAHGDGCCVVLVQDDAVWQRWTFHTSRRCGPCGREYPQLEPHLFSFNSPLGACPQCEGFGNILALDWNRIVPDKSKTLQEGALAPWNSPSYQSCLTELLELAPRLGIPTDVPFSALSETQVAVIRDGCKSPRYGGMKEFFEWVEKRKYKMHHRVFLSRWRSSSTCSACAGKRLRPEALAVTLGDRNFAEWMSCEVGEMRRAIAKLALTPFQQSVCRTALLQLEARLHFLDDVGLGYLTLDRTLRTLSGGEAQRVALTSALGASLVNMLYVLDEPSVGLHPQDVERLLGTLHALRDRGNTVVVVEHEEAIIRAADEVIEIGPGAGENGGELVFQGTPGQLTKASQSLTGDYLSGKRLSAIPEKRRSPNRGWIRLAGARGHNLKNLTVEFPLGVLCVVTGVSGSGKSSLVQDTLYGALCHRKQKDCDAVLPYDDIFGDGQVDDVVLIDQSPIGRSPRSNPVTYIKAFDLIRAVFAETAEAQARQFTAGHFSFNVEGGRCEACQGDGSLEIDMQFLPPVFMKCAECDGTRYRKEVRAVQYRGRNIADVLQMTVREAFGFFRGQTKVQTKLKQLIDVGLDYLRLGQAANTLSSGEAQRVKLAAYLSGAARNRTLFILDEPTTGLHFADVTQLLDCFEALVSVGHSLIVVEHNLQVMLAADYVIDLGPGPAREGGQIVAQGTPEKIARSPDSATARILAKSLLTPSKSSKKK